MCQDNTFLISVLITTTPLFVVMLLVIRDFYYSGRFRQKLLEEQQKFQQDLLNLKNK